MVQKHDNKSRSNQQYIYFILHKSISRHTETAQQMSMGNNTILANKIPWPGKPQLNTTFTKDGIKRISKAQNYTSNNKM